MPVYPLNNCALQMSGVRMKRACVKRTDEYVHLSHLFLALDDAGRSLSCTQKVTTKRTVYL